MYNPKSVFAAASEIYRAGFLEILGWAGHFSNFVACEENLCKHLVVKYKVVGIDVVVDCTKHF